MRRGALGSKGRSSWSGRPELDDYTSCAAFFLQYMINIRPIPASGSNLTPEQPLVIIGGYSYGSLILRHLPPLANILQLLSCPSPGSAANEIQLRARKLADQSNLEWNSLTQRHERESTTRKSTEAKAPLMMGGEETSPEIRRSSRDKRRSLDGGFRAGLGNRLRSLSVRRCEDGAPSIGFHEDKASTTLTIPQIRYLLISPLTPPIATLIAPALGHRFWGFGREGSQETVGRHPTLVVYGDKDIFTSAKKTRTWSEQLEDVPESSLSSVEISGAGHFWVEPGMEEKLRATLKEWELEVR
jgi:pimeloyl-ACP methyl ester carboxylesterase